MKILLVEDDTMLNEMISEYITSTGHMIKSAKSGNESLEILDNVFYTDAHFQFKLIQNDEDDNKFVDCAIASNVHYLVSNDKHFSILKTIDFPNVNIIKMNEFIKLLNQ